MKYLSLQPVFFLVPPAGTVSVQIFLVSFSSSCFEPLIYGALRYIPWLLLFFHPSGYLVGVPMLFQSVNHIRLEFRSALNLRPLEAAIFQLGLGIYFGPSCLVAGRHSP